MLKLNHVLAAIAAGDLDDRDADKIVRAFRERRVEEIAAELMRLQLYRPTLVQLAHAILDVAGSMSEARLAERMAEYYEDVEEVRFDATHCVTLARALNELTDHFATSDHEGDSRIVTAVGPPPPALQARWS